VVVGHDQAVLADDEAAACSLLPELTRTLRYVPEEVAKEVGNNPALLKLLANVGKNFSEDGMGDKGLTGDSSVSDAQKTIGIITSLLFAGG
jgi:hypothetical protein